MAKFLGYASIEAYPRMIYTLNMLKRIFQNKSNLAIFAGGILILAGTIGALINYYAAPEIIPFKSAYRYYLKEKIDNQSVNSVIETTVIKDVEVVTNPYPSLNPYLHFIHVETPPGIEIPNIPDRIEIPSIKLNAPVIIADYNLTKIEGETFGQWQAPSEFAAGWHPNSALLGKAGNTVINGHHNEYGLVFGRLVDVKEGDIINIYSGEQKYSFIVANRMILPEKYMDAKTRLENARWLSKSDDVRLTLVTCWPDTSNTHRLILVARPVYIQ